MSMILIYGIIISLVILGINNSNNVSIDISKKKLIPKEIRNNFYLNDTRIAPMLSYCSFQLLQLKDIDNNKLKECIKIPTVLINKGFSLDNSVKGQYKVCYNYNYNNFANHKLNENKTLSKINNDDNTVCVTRNYNNYFDSILLNETINFFDNNNSLDAINLIYEDSNGTRITTFNYDNITYNKSDFKLNTRTLFDNEQQGDVVYFSNKNKNILYQYDNNNSDLKIYSTTNISTVDKKSIEKYQKINQNLYIINNNNNNDGNIEIIKK